MHLGAISVASLADEHGMQDVNDLTGLQRAELACLRSAAVVVRDSLQQQLLHEALLLPPAEPALDESMKH